MTHEDSATPSLSNPRVSPRLVALNLALLAILAVVTITGSRSASAQPTTTTPGTQPNRGRGEYTMVSGRYQGSTTSAVYIIDAANQELIVLGWDRSQGRLNPIGHRSLTDDAHYLTKPR